MGTEVDKYGETSIESRPKSIKTIRETKVTDKGPTVEIRTKKEETRIYNKQ